MSARIPIIYSEQFLRHDTGAYHPERSQRLTAIVQALQAAPWSAQLEWRSPASLQTRNPLPAVEQVHALNYIQAIEQLAQRGGGHLDADTIVSPQSYAVALLAVNAWLDGVDAVLAQAQPAFVLARPPGHHAVREHGMGFCLFSNAAIAAHYALTLPGVKRVAILDWDVHHGNGTQAIVETNPSIAYCSLHQFPCYPGTGEASERGVHGNVLNIPITPGSTMAVYHLLFCEQVIPFLTAFQPHLLIVSAGYDANAADPLASINLHPQDYGQFTAACLGLTRRILFGLEGGYDLEALAQSVVATLAPCLSGFSTSHP